MITCVLANTIYVSDLCEYNSYVFMEQNLSPVRVSIFPGTQEQR